MVCIQMYTPFVKYSAPRLVSISRSRHFQLSPSFDIKHRLKHLSHCMDPWNHLLIGEPCPLLWEPPRRFVISSHRIDGPALFYCCMHNVHNTEMWHMIFPTLIICHRTPWDCSERKRYPFFPIRTDQQRRELVSVWCFCLVRSFFPFTFSTTITCRAALWGSGCTGTVRSIWKQKKNRLETEANLYFLSGGTARSSVIVR